jgi:hypothetical protein
VKVEKVSEKKNKVNNNSKKKREKEKGKREKIAWVVTNIRYKYHLLLS